VLGPTCDPFKLGGDDFELREYYCPECAALLEADMLLRSAPIEWDLDLSSTSSPAAP
jgi:acetone carboxylase gamma subunit